jgi:hypothetical protein
VASVGTGMASVGTATKLKKRWRKRKHEQKEIKTIPS